MEVALYKPQPVRAQRRRTKKAKAKTLAVVPSTPTQQKPKQPQKVVIQYQNPPITKQMVKSITTRGRKKADLQLYRHIKNIEDAFLFAYLHHLMMPEVEYPLPGIAHTGVVGVDSINTPSLGEGGFGTGLPASMGTSYVNPQDAANAVDTQAYHAVTGSGVAVGRYETFSGVRTYTINTQTLSSGQLELIIFYDPYDMFYPIKVISPPVNPTSASTYNDISLYSTMPSAAPFGPDWNNDPFLFAKVYAGTSTPLLTNPDTGNLYFIGGAVLDVEVLNKNLYTNTAFQTRTSTNTVHTFVDNLQLLWRTDTGTALGFTDVPVEAMGCTSVYSGERWSQCYRPESTMNPSDIKLYHSHALRRAWSVGAPVIRVLIRTQTTNAGTPGPVSFNVKLNTWIGISPVYYKTSGACTEETVPFALPGWARVARSYGFLHSPDYSVASAYSNVATQVIAETASMVPATTPLSKKLQENPAAAAKLLGLVGKKSKWLKTAADWGGKLIAIESVISKVLSALPVVLA